MSRLTRASCRHGVGMLLLASLTLAPRPAAGAERQVPASRPDVQRCELLIRPDLAAGRLRLTATLDLSNPSGDKEFSFFLAAWYDTFVVRSRAGPATLTREGDVVTVRVARAAVHERLIFRLS